MPANTRFCAVQIEVICLHSSTHVQLRSTQLFKKKRNNVRLSQEAFTTCYINMSHMFNVLCHAK